MDRCLSRSQGNAVCEPYGSACAMRVRGHCTCSPSRAHLCRGRHQCPTCPCGIHSTFACRCRQSSLSNSSDALSFTGDSWPLIYALKACCETGPMHMQSAPELAAVQTLSHRASAVSSSFSLCSTVSDFTYAVHAHCETTLTQWCPRPGCYCSYVGWVHVSSPLCEVDMHQRSSQLL